MSLLKVNNVTDLGDDAVITDGALVGAGKILQMVTASVTTTATTTSLNAQDTGLEVTITPTDAANRIIIVGHGFFSYTQSNTNSAVIVRFNGGGFSDTPVGALVNSVTTDFVVFTIPFTVSEIAGSTLARTYKLRFHRNDPATNAHFNRDRNNGGVGYRSGMTAIEVAP